MKAATLQLARTHAWFTHCTKSARRDYKLTSLGALFSGVDGLSLTCPCQKLKKKNVKKSIGVFGLFLQRNKQNLDPLNKGFKDADRNLIVQIPAIFMGGADTKWNIPKHAITKGSILI